MAAGATTDSPIKLQAVTLGVSPPQSYPHPAREGTATHIARLRDTVIHVGIHSSKSGCYKTLQHTPHSHRY